MDSTWKINTGEQKNAFEYWAVDPDDEIGSELILWWDLVSDEVFRPYNAGEIVPLHANRHNEVIRLPVIDPQVIFSPS